MKSTIEIGRGKLPYETPAVVLVVHEEDYQHTTVDVTVHKTGDPTALLTTTVKLADLAAAVRKLGAK